MLARLSVGGKRPPTPTDVSKVLYPLVKRRSSPPEWKRLLERALASLRDEGLIEAERLRMTPAGAARLNRALGTKSPRAAKDWREFKRKYLPRLVFDGLPAARDGTVRPAAAVLAHRLGVTPTSKGKSSTPAAEISGVVDSWLRATLGLSGQQALTFNTLRGALLARELGLPARALGQVAGVAIATFSEATSGKDDAVSDAFTLRWLCDDAPPDAMSSAPASRPSASNAGTASNAGKAPNPGNGINGNVVAPIERIAAKALQAANGPGARQFGPNKVFIGSVWRALAGDPEIAGLGEAGFKSQLAEAHRRGLLKLGRADLVAAMDPGELSASEIIHQNATYHFILRGAFA